MYVGVFNGDIFEQSFLGGIILQSNIVKLCFIDSSCPCVALCAVASRLSMHPFRYASQISTQNKPQKLWINFYRIYIINYQYLAL